MSQEPKLMKPKCPDCETSFVNCTSDHFDSLIVCWQCWGCGRHLYTKRNHSDNTMGYVPDGKIDERLN